MTYFLLARYLLILLLYKLYLMEKIISSIPVYNLLTNLIPGTILAALLKFCVEDCDIFSLTNNIWLLAVILYFLGVVNSRISSLIIVPLLRKIKLISGVDHAEFTKAELKDSTGKLTQLSRMGTEYRSYVSVFFTTIVVKLIFLWPMAKALVTEYSCVILLILGFILFLFSYKKQVVYISSRVKNLNNNH